MPKPHIPDHYRTYRIVDHSDPYETVIRDYIEAPTRGAAAVAILRDVFQIELEDVNAEFEESD